MNTYIKKSQYNSFDEFKQKTHKNSFASFVRTAINYSIVCYYVNQIGELQKEYSEIKSIKDKTERTTKMNDFLSPHYVYAIEFVKNEQREKTADLNSIAKSIMQYASEMPS